MDEKVEGLTFGIRQGDDAVVVGEYVYNVEGPYPLNIGRKTGLIHTCADIVAMGGKPLFGFDAMQVDSIEQAKEITEDIKKQSNGIGVPIVGGNTQLENDLKPCISFTVVGKLIGKPVPDSDCRVDDKILMVGHVMEGELGERVHRANVKFNTIYDLIGKKVEIHAMKDASRGGWFGNLTEMLVKSQKGCKITSIPYQSPTRYMGTMLMSVPAGEVDRIVSTAAKHGCPCVEVGTITERLQVKVGSDTMLTTAMMRKLIRGVPYKKAKSC
ncbi:MAG: AIR synthase-related protein [Candidatus Altiarchaeota archaeon]